MSEPRDTEPDTTPVDTDAGTETGPDTSITVTVAEDLADIVTDRMWQWGVRAVSETGTGNGLVEVTTSVGNDRDAINRAVATLDPAWPVELRSVDASVGQVAPEYLSPTWYSPGHVSVPSSIHPADLSDTDGLSGPGDLSSPGGEHGSEAPLVTVIDQGSAFGLGDHPTTSTSMALLADHLEAPDHVIASLIDVGCGTGALAVLAAQLGVEEIRAIDIADAAVESTLRNAELNDVVGRIDVDTTDVADIDGTYDVVMANILAPTLISMADDLKRITVPGGSLFISGILEARHQHVLDALAPLEPVGHLARDGWITIELRHPVDHPVDG